jgi:hypothetical protein
MSNNQFQDLLNALIRSKLPEINTALIGAIRSGGLDPMANVTSGSQTIGSIGIWPFRIDAVASYSLRQLTGLSTLFINSLVITSANATADGSALRGTVSLQANLNSDLRMQVGGEFKAGVAVGIGGNVTMSAASINATGNFEATIGNQLCLTRISVSDPGLNYRNVQVNIDGLGFLNSLLRPLENFILGQVKGPIINLIAGAVTPAVNNALKGVFPQCTSLG